MADDNMQNPDMNREEDEETGNAPMQQEQGGGSAPMNDEDRPTGDGDSEDKEENEV